MTAYCADCATEVAARCADPGCPITFRATFSHNLRRGTLGGGLPPSAPAHLLHDAPHGLANRDRFAGSVPPVHSGEVIQP
jgi:hypothetical protein